jgi:hypothetical protein
MKLLLWVEPRHAAAETSRIDLELASVGEELRRGGTAVQLVCVRLDVRSRLNESDVRNHQLRGVLHPLDRAEFLARTSDDAWRAQAAEIARLAGFQGLRFWVQNSSPVTARDANIRLELPAVEGLEIIGEAQHPRCGSLGMGAPVTERDAILDGEVVALDQEGRQDFQLLMRGGGNLHYAVFDVLWLKGKDCESARFHDGSGS